MYPPLTRAAEDEPTMDKVRIGVVGCGAIANGMHLPGIATMREMGLVEIVAVADAIPEKAESTATKFDIPFYYGDYQQLLANHELDLVVTLTPIPEHFPVNLAALRSGRNVYSQKPMATTVEDATILIDEARKQGVKLASAPEHPTRPMILAMRDLIREGAIGKVAFARVQSSHEGPERHHVARDSTWFYKAGSSPILDLGVHGLSQITAILGPVQRLSSFSGRSVPVRVHEGNAFAGKAIDVEIDDNSLLMLDFGDARFGILDSTYCVPASLGPRLEIYGTEGTLAIAGRGANDQVLKFYERSAHEWRDIEVSNPPPVRDLGVLHLVNSLRNGSDLVLTGERGRHLIEVMAKAPVAAREGRTLDMETTF